MGRSKVERFVVAVAAGNFLFLSAPGNAQTHTFVDLTAGVGYSTNPFLIIGDDQGSGYGRLSAFASHSWSNERGSTGLTGYVENTSYFDDHGSEQLVDLGFNTQQAVSERVRLFGSANFSADTAGQLSNRFVSVPTEPLIPDPTAPPPVTVADPDLFAFSTRHYRLSGQVGAAIRATEVSSVTLSGGAQHVWFRGTMLDDYTTLFASGAYDRTLSERTSVGGRLNVSHTMYSGSDDSNLIINPELTIRTQLSEAWDASGAVGVILARSKRNDVEDWSTNFSLSGSMCRSGETERLCGKIARHASNSGIAELTTSTSVGVDWFKRLDEDQTVQLSASAIRYAAEDNLGQDFTTHHYRLAGNYDRRISNRLFAGVSANVRSLHHDGPDPDLDIGGSVYLRYRLGDIG